MFHGLQKTGGLEDLGARAAAVFQERGQVVQHLPGLLGNATRHGLAGLGVERDGAGTEQQVAKRHGLGVRADRGREAVAM
jgi:hypothetical protein